MEEHEEDTIASLTEDRNNQSITIERLDKENRDLRGINAVLKDQVEYTAKLLDTISENLYRVRVKSERTE